MPNAGEQGWRSGESTRLHQCGPGSNPGVDAICGLSLLLVLSLAPRGFSPGTPVFPSPQNQHFQILIRSGTHGHVSTSSYELLSVPWVNKLQLQKKYYQKRHRGQRIATFVIVIPNVADTNFKGDGERIFRFNGCSGLSKLTASNCA